MITRKVFRRLATCKNPSRSSRQRLSTSSDQALDNLVRRPLSQGRDRVIFSGIQPTGVPHLGNFLGALRPWVELQDEPATGDVRNYCVVDLHALTVRQHPEMLSKWRKESFASLLAVGLDAKKSNIFFQSDVPAHSELMWLLSTVASTGYLSRMTQWKSKLELSDSASMDDEKSRERLRLGLFSYPVLQAADILLYDTTHVPIGADQIQHLEFTRSLANSFNTLYGDGNMFVVPKGIISPAKRIMSLRNPTKKMSKSDPDENSRILITDTPDAIHAKIKSAVTDSEDGISYDIEKRPGISNLIDILKYTSGTNFESVDLAKDSAHLSKKSFKHLVADSVVFCLSGIRERYDAILSEPYKVWDAAAHGGRLMRQTSRSKVERVHRAMGIQSGRPSTTANDR